MTIEEIQNEVAKEWNEAFDYRALRNGVQVGNIKMIHLDKVNLEVCKRYAKVCNNELVEFCKYLNMVGGLGFEIHGRAKDLIQKSEGNLK